MPLGIERPVGDAPGCGHGAGRQLVELGGVGAVVPDAVELGRARIEPASVSRFAVALTAVKRMPIDERVTVPGEARVIRS